MNEEKRSRVLVCPLGWGLGHASRLIPVIKHIYNQGYKVFVAGDDPQLMLIKGQFPDIDTIIFPSFKVKLSGRTNQLFPLLGIALKLPYYILKEHLEVKRIIKENRIDLIVSDNRYGLWCKGVKSVFITHQLKVFFPKPFQFLEPLGSIMIRTFAQKFDFCLIPDFNDERNYAGELSHPSKHPNNVTYIGILSRFKDLNFEKNTQTWDLVGIASGPSPQREIFIELIERISTRYNLKTLIIKGDPTEGVNIHEGKNISYVGHLEDKDFAGIILSSRYLIARAGYSTIMDFAALGVSGLIIPTPGQTEQEYLACYLSKKGLFSTCNQNDMNSVDIILAQTARIVKDTSRESLAQTFREVLSSLQ